jgi:hypothetical protein
LVIEGIPFFFWILFHPLASFSFHEAIGSWAGKETGAGNKRRREKKKKKKTTLPSDEEQNGKGGKDREYPVGRANGQTADGDGSDTIQ